MKKFVRAVSGVVSVIAFCGAAMAGPTYETDETRRVIENMVDAHGGMERWRAIDSIRFDNVMHNNFHAPNEFAWWIAHEVIDQKTRRVWQRWPMDSAQLAFDGERVWTQGWQRANPPPFQVHFFYYFVNLPWLTQDDGVRLSAVSRYDWEGLKDGLYEIRMDFEQAPGIGKSGNDFFVLYIDPASYRLVGYQYASGYQPLLDIMNMPDGKKVFGPLRRLITRVDEVDGLVFPVAFRTMPSSGRIAGNHVILNIDISQPFDSERVQMPEGAEVFSGPLTTE